MQTIGASQLNLIYFIKSTMIDGKISSRIASWVFWKILVLVYYTSVIYLFKQTALLNHKVLHYAAFILSLCINQIFVATTIELIIRSQKIYSYLPQSKPIFLNSIIINCLIILLANLVICCMLPLHFSISIKEIAVLSLLQLFLTLPAVLISVLIGGVILAILKKSGNANSKRSFLIAGNSPIFATKFLVWRKKWIDFGVIFTMLLILLSGILSAIYFKNAQFVIMALAINLLFLQTSIYQISTNDLTEKFSLKISPFKFIIYDFLRLLLGQGVLVIGAVVIALINGRAYFPTTLIIIALSAYLLFAAMLYHNRFGKNLCAVAMVGEIMVLIFTGVALLPFMPLFAAFFMYQNIKNQPKGFYGLS